MKRTNILMSSICALALLSSNPTFADTKCKVIEFAELQTLNKKELDLQYCLNNINIKYASKQRATNMNIAMLEGSGLGGKSALEADRQNENGVACRGENERIERVLKKKGHQPPKCD